MDDMSNTWRLNGIGMQGVRGSPRGGAWCGSPSDGQRPDSLLASLDCDLIATVEENERADYPCARGSRVASIFLFSEPRRRGCEAERNDPDPSNP